MPDVSTDPQPMFMFSDSGEWEIQYLSNSNLQEMKDAIEKEIEYLALRKSREHLHTVVAGVNDAAGMHIYDRSAFTGTKEQCLSKRQIANAKYITDDEGMVIYRWSNVKSDWIPVYGRINNSKGNTNDESGNTN